MTTRFKPLLAATLEEDTFDKVKYPILASPKLDGIRILVKDGVVLTRSLKPVRNIEIQEALGQEKFNGLDGEIIVGDPCDPLAFRRTTHGVMSSSASTDWNFYVFDDFLTDEGFNERYKSLVDRVLHLGSDSLILVPHLQVDSEEALLEYEKKILEEGYEGIMLRSLEGIYKLGRSTLNQGILLKLKRFKDDEGEIIGFVERCKNMNEKKTNELGRSERSSHKENMIPEDTLGAFLVKSDAFPESFTVGSGLSDKERKEIWDKKERYLGTILKFKHFSYGNYDQPRFPTYLGIRFKDDL